MKISTVESLHCDAGWRNFSFLKITTDDGLVGYSEYNPDHGYQAVAAAIDQLSTIVLGTDPFNHDVTFAGLYGMTRLSSGGVNAQAIAAIENALLDIKGKALGVPVYKLLGGAQRDRLRLYWSHCGTRRMDAEMADALGKPLLKTLDDVSALGAEVRAAGFTGLKCNQYVFGEKSYTHGWRRSFPERNAEKALIRAVHDQIEAFNSGTDNEVDILVDLNFNFRPEGYMRMLRALEPVDPFWCEMDILNPEALAHVRAHTNLPVASCEALYGIRDFRAYLQHKAMDVAIIDVPWNGIWQSYKIAMMADAHEVNIAPHNYYGHLATMMSAHLCAAVPNFRIMEIDIDDVGWKDELVSQVPEIENGHLIVPDRPGWGCDVDEDAVRAHPPIKRTAAGPKLPPGS